MDFETNKRLTSEIAVIQSKRLRNKIAGYTTHLMKRIQKGPVRGISFKLQEEERERKDQYVPEVSALDLSHTNGQLEIDADTEFKDIIDKIENNDAFIEICGRNGSSALELFWDIVDEKKQILKVKKNLVDSVISTMKNGNTYDEKMWESLETFSNALKSTRDERLANLDLTLGDGGKGKEITMIYTLLKEEFELKKQQEREKYLKKMDEDIAKFARWIYDNDRNLGENFLRMEGTRFVISNRVNYEDEYEKLLKFDQFKPLKQYEIELSTTKITKKIIEEFVSEYNKHASRKRQSSITSETNKTGDKRLKTGVATVLNY